MKTLQHFCILVAILVAGGAHVHAQGTAVTYTGHLLENGTPATGTYDFTFTLFDTCYTGLPLAGRVVNGAVTVTNGLFTTAVDFGPGVFTGGTDWLEIGVRTNGTNGFTSLGPRQQILPVPYALMASSASNLLGSVSAAQLSGTLSSSVLADPRLTNFVISAMGRATPSSDGSASSNTVSTAQVHRAMRVAAARVPTMEYLSGNLLGCREDDVISTAQQLKAMGLVALGYTMVGVDAGWSATNRASTNVLQTNPVKFPHGIPWLVSQLRTYGCSLGLYLTIIGCGYNERGPDQGLCPSSAYADGYQLATWGIRNLKVDRVGESPATVARYALEQVAAGLDDGAVAAGLDEPVCLLIVMNVNPPQAWMPDVVNSIYVGPDPNDSSPASHQAFLRSFLSNPISFVGPGCQYNPEGIGHPSDQPWWNTNYARVDMGVFCLAPFPLALANLSDAGLVAYTNRAAIQINQDPLVSPGRFLSTNATGCVLYRPLANGDMALGLWNLSTNAATPFAINLSTIPSLRTNSVHVQDVFDRAITYASGTLSATVAPGGFNLYRLSSEQ